MTNSTASRPAAASSELEPLLLAGVAVRGRVRMDVRDPFDGELIAEVSTAEPVHVTHAVRAAYDALKRSWPPGERVDTLAATAEALAENSESFARLIAREGIKTIREARREVTRAVGVLRLSSHAASFQAEEPSGPRWQAEIRRDPIGVVAAITPYNDPLNLVAHKLGPALAAGNSVILKPHPQTPLTALRLADLLMASGLPAGRLSVLPGGSRPGAALVTHPLVRFVSFTGGRVVGEWIMRNLGTRRATLELGGVCVTVVGGDFDVDAAAAALCEGAFAAAGQNCLHVQRALIHESVYQDVVDALAERTSRLRTGNKLAEDTDIGPMIDTRAAAGVHSFVIDAIAAGARNKLKQEWQRGVSYPPTLLERLGSNSRLLSDEIFGPVTVLEPFSTAGQVLGEINRLDGCLQIGLLTHDDRIVTRVLDDADVGGVVLGATSDVRVDELPFGGTGRAGRGREGVRSAVEAMTEPKVLLRPIDDLAPGPPRRHGRGVRPVVKTRR